jgi:hypothetical protein
MRTIKTYFKRAPFYNALIGSYVYRPEFPRDRSKILPVSLIAELSSWIRHGFWRMSQIEIRRGGVWRMRDALPAGRDSTTNTGTRWESVAKMRTALPNIGARLAELHAGRCHSRGRGHNGRN